MNTLLIYILKANFVLICAFLFYKVLFQTNTFHKWNRFYFIASLMLAGILPTINYSKHFIEETNPAIAFIQLDPAIINTIADSSNIEYTNYLSLAIVIGILFFLCRFIIQLISLIRLYIASDRRILNDRKVIHLNTETGPFSFFGWIFINTNLHSEVDIDEIIAHESIHAQQFHSLDQIVYEIAAILCWYNPIIWLMKQEMKQNLEYLVDRQILNTGYNKHHYQYHLLRISNIHTKFEITSNFYFKQLKNRIMKMNKQQSTHYGLIKYLLLVPLFLSITLVMNAQHKPTKQKPKDGQANSSIVSDSSKIKGEEIQIAEDKNNNNKDIIKDDVVIIVDGKEILNKELSSVKPEDIASISVLKGNAGEAYYNGRQKNGAVLITTKAAEAEKSKDQ